MIIKEFYKLSSYLHYKLLVRLSALRSIYEKVEISSNQNIIFSFASRVLRISSLFATVPIYSSIIRTNRDYHFPLLQYKEKIK